MRMYDIIRKKRDHSTLNASEIDYWIQNYVQGQIPDYQSAAMLMACYLNGLDEREMLFLTQSMVASGEKMDLSAITGIKVDKHSTGGVGDKTTLVFAPLMAALGFKVAKMSGRGLGHTGGTLDKVASLPGFHDDFYGQDFLDLVQNNGLAIIGQSKELVPADKLLYALRDVTATVDSIPLIAASIMSKKIAMSSDILILDVKFGNGAFMKTPEKAVELAQAMVEIGLESDIKTAAIISNMESPLGNCIGNSLELYEAVQTLRGQGPDDLSKLTLVLVKEVLSMAGKKQELEKAEEYIKNGFACEKLLQFLQAQGADISSLHKEAKFPLASYQIRCLADESGFVRSLPAEQVGMLAMRLGAGRQKKEDKIDPLAGIVLLKKPGDWVEKGEPLAIIHTNHEDLGQKAAIDLQKIFGIADEKPVLPPMIYGTVSESGVVIDGYK